MTTLAPATTASTLPFCNMSENGKSYYSEKPLNSVFGTFFGTVGLYISLTISFLLVISVFFSYRSAGFGFLTIFISFFICIILSSVINNIITIKKAKDSRTDKCIS